MKFLKSKIKEKQVKEKLELKKIEIQDQEKNEIDLSIIGKTFFYLIGGKIPNPKNKLKIEIGKKI